VFGGEHDSRVPISNNFIVYDLNSSKWSSIENKGNLSSIPCSRVAHSSCLINDKIYIFGGRVGVGMGEGSLNDLYEFDTSSNNWKLLDDGKSINSPVARSYHAMTSLSNRIFLFGGCGENRLNDFYSFDISKNEWSRLAQDERIAPRGGSSICSYKSNGQEYIYLVGGFCGHELNDCFVYNVQNNSWSKATNLPLGLSVFALTSVDDGKFAGSRLILHGGEIGPSTEGHKSAGEFSNDTYLFDGDNWSKVEAENKPVPRAWHAGTYSNGKFYAYGGLLENSERNGELFELAFE